MLNIVVDAFLAVPFILRATEVVLLGLSAIMLLITTVRFLRTQKEERKTMKFQPFLWIDLVFLTLVFSVGINFILID